MYHRRIPHTLNQKQNRKKREPGAHELEGDKCLAGISVIRAAQTSDPLQTGFTASAQLLPFRSRKMGHDWICMLMYRGR